MNWIMNKRARYPLSGSLMRMIYVPIDCGLIGWIEFTKPLQGFRTELLYAPLLQ
jgi:hypothetical protein